MVRTCGYNHRNEHSSACVSSPVIFRLHLILGFIVMTAHAAECCTIPVFRYALDRWEADKFHLLLPASASGDAALQDALRPLRANGKANLDMVTSREAEQKEAVLMGSKEGAAPVWKGAMDEKTLAEMLDSPARSEILKQILAGDSMIWVIVDSGSPLDAAQAERIEKRLKFLEQVASLPIQDPNDPDSQLGPGPPLKLKFATLRLRLDDPAEKLLIQMLAGPVAEEVGGGAFAAVVFGRGRVLGAWPLTVLDDTTLEDACMFLVGRCSCRVKGENPGWDLLMNVDWDKALIQAGETKAAHAEAAEPPPAPVMKTPEVVTISAAEPVPAPPDKREANWVWFGIGGAALGFLLLMMKRRP